MGLFDTINCQLELPQPKNPQGYHGNCKEFQTKGLEKCLELYKIDKGGYLHKYDNSLKHWVLTLYSGEFTMLGSKENLHAKKEYWIEYEVKFFHGNCINIKLIDFEARSIDNKPLKKILNNENDMNDINIEYNLVKNRGTPNKDKRGIFITHQGVTHTYFRDGTILYCGHTVEILWGNEYYYMIKPDGINYVYKVNKTNIITSSQLI